MKEFDYNFDYTKTMMMKLPMAFPNRKGGSTVINTFDDALEIIKRVDLITLGCPKIIYLVGWQYNGHDDKYPDFFEVNSALKCKDKSPLESMLWLIDEAENYHTTVSVHINFNDAYENAPSFDKFVKTNALIRKKNGKPHAIERYNGMKCYKTSHKEYYESGLFKAMFDRLLTVLPLEKSGTVHVDNFQCYKNYSPYISIKEMQKSRRKMIEYVKSKGIDITSEFTYKEDEALKNKPFLGLPREHHAKSPMDTTGIIPASWWLTRMTREEIVTTPPSLYCGGLYRDKRYGNYLYGNIHGESAFGKYNDKNTDWQAEFIKEYATVQIPFWFLNNYKKIEIKGKGKKEYCVFENNIVSFNKNRKITVNGVTVKENNNLLLPAPGGYNIYIAYSEKGDERSWQIDKKFKSAKISVYSNGVYNYSATKPVTDGKLKLKINAKELLSVELS